MSEITAQMVTEIRALGWHCLGFCPKVWLVITAVCIFSVGLILGMWLAALLGANGEDDDDR